MKPKSILLIVNPVSGKMKSKTGLFEMLDELYRFDSPADEAARSLPLNDPTEETALDAEIPQEEALQPTYGRLTPQTLGGDPAPHRHVTVCTTLYRGHAAQLAASADKAGYDTVICCGGDGTLNETISGLLTRPAESRPSLGYIPAGSTNDFAASLGLPTTLRGAARVAVCPTEMPVDIGRFAPVGCAEEAIRHFSYIASFGIFTSASYSTPQIVKNRFGHLAYLVTGVRDLANIQSHHAVVDMDGTRLEGNYVFGAVTNTTSAAGIFKFPADQVSMSDGQLELFLVHEPDTLADFNTIAAAIVSGNFDNCPLIEFYHAQSVTITLDEPLSWSLDGEEAAAGTQVNISCLASAIRFKKRTT